MKIKKRISVFLTIALLLSLNALSGAFAVNGVTYLDENGALQTLTEDYTELTITQPDRGQEITSGWYTVTGEVTLNERLFIGGDVKLILKDGATLDVKGIVVTQGNPFTVYAQSQPVLTAAGELDETQSTTGKIVTNAYVNYAGIGSGGTTETHGDITINGGIINANGNNAAGIGGGGTKSGGTITINGGYIVATSSNNGAGIGSGGSSSSSTPALNGGSITINGGTVKATGGRCGAGIGGGNYGNSGSITINGGTITATGGDYGAGIGSGYCGNGEAINISGGTVTAKGGECAAGIGGGNNGNGGTISISGGTVSATGGEKGAGIGSGRGNTSNIITGGNISIENASVTAQGGGYSTNGGAGIGGGSYSTFGSIEIKSGTVTAIGGNYAAGIGTGNANHSSTGAITISGGRVSASGGNYAAGIGTGGDSQNGNQFGNVSISNATVFATGGNYAAGIGTGVSHRGSFGNVEISANSDVTATAGKSGAGIGMGGSPYENSGFGNITLTNSMVRATGGASSNSIGVGIGKYGTDSSISIGTITINSGTVVAKDCADNSGDHNYAFSKKPELASGVNWQISHSKVGQYIPSPVEDSPSASDFTEYSFVRVSDGTIRATEFIGLEARGGQRQYTYIKLNIAQVGTYQLVIAAYNEDGSLKNLALDTITATKAETVDFEKQYGFPLQKGDKIMLWNSLTDMKPICEAGILSR